MAPLQRAARRVGHAVITSIRLTRAVHRSRRRFLRAIRRRRLPHQATTTPRSQRPLSFTLPLPLAFPAPAVRSSTFKFLRRAGRTRRLRAVPARYSNVSAEVVVVPASSVALVLFTDALAAAAEATAGKSSPRQRSVHRRQSRSVPAAMVAVATRRICRSTLLPVLVAQPLEPSAM